MRVLLIFVFAVFLYADISYVISVIKQIEEYKPKFKPFIDYNIFVSKFNNIEKKQKKRVVFDKKLTVYAIFLDKVNINGIWLKEDDEIEGYKIVKITNNRVILKKNGKKKILTFNYKVLKVGK